MTPIDAGRLTLSKGVFDLVFARDIPQILGEEGEEDAKQVCHNDVSSMKQQGWSGVSARFCGFRIYNHDKKIRTK
ncbi:hypothetical protein [Azospirillum cavernae]|uniref:hypothetical protein n=1 Tax=Azospirillum cavernae TaxID=2320860 RepID=UPI0011C3F87C|nr:hypothetical protein [Azospirillum cavernae]